jgi:thiol-disulfide isomerase/thioredoxin
MSKITFSRHPRRLFLVALYTLAAVGGCSQPARENPLEFTLPDTGGKLHSLSDYKGKWVIVNYWATWCKPCLKEIPQLITLSREYENNAVVVLGIDYEDLDLKTLLGFMHDHHMSYPVLRTNPLAAQKLGPILGLPMTFVITPQGELATTLVGQITRSGVEQAIDTEALQRGLPVPRRNKAKEVS